MSENQIRAARALIGMSQPDLASAAGVSTMTVKRAEGSGQPKASAEAIKKLQAALTAAGVEFTNGDQPGVRLKKQNP